MNNDKLNKLCIGMCYVAIIFVFLFGIFGVITQLTK